MSLTNVSTQITALTAEVDGRVRVDAVLTAAELDTPRAFAFWISADDVANQTDLLVFITGLMPAEGAGAAAQAEADIAATSAMIATQAALDTDMQTNTDAMASVSVTMPVDTVPSPIDSAPS